MNRYSADVPCHFRKSHSDNRVDNTLGLYITKETRLFPNEPPEEINTSGARIRYHRMLRNLTIRELAAKAGISEVALSRIERNIGFAKPKTLRTLSELLKQPISYLGCFEEMSEGTMGEKIKKARHYHGLTKTELGARMKVDAKTIYNWELDRTPPPSKYHNSIEAFTEIISSLNSLPTLHGF
ncbi:helix-turn-helix transcriptional regulator [Paenibacillus polymyxa]|uniref:helix-turn-helix transcriptional regulator n=1 Tax=Paenibacillus polymyxa TaxID=1406 RepID=UPI002AB3E706|nr:helix-turn-helix transcriptional regulator [Paenibacillus polymyxa]MDY8116736.1 helix-turn-helix transcriptional regulator [Paenibacillus polymyxa]